VIATAELPHTVTIEERDGTTGGGSPAYATPYTVRARIEQQRKQVRTADGAVAYANSVAIIRPRPIPSGSLLTHGTDRYEVLDSADVMELRRVERTELVLDGPRPAS
jgi:hypothetical protein